MITVLFFAAARDATGVSARTLDARQPMTVREFSDLLCRDYPLLSALMPSIRFAVNQTVADHASIIADGDEVAVLPPVSGG
jgi:molybdopterin converting factor subunit 1